MRQSFGIPESILLLTVSQDMGWLWPRCKEMSKNLSGMGHLKAEHTRASTSQQACLTGFDCVPLGKKDF